MVPAGSARAGHIRKVPLYNRERVRTRTRPRRIRGAPRRTAHHRGRRGSSERVGRRTAAAERARVAAAAAVAAALGEGAAAARARLTCVGEGSGKVQGRFREGSGKVHGAAAVRARLTTRYVGSSGCPPAARRRSERSGLRRCQAGCRRARSTRPRRTRANGTGGATVEKMPAVVSRTRRDRKGSYYV